MLSCAICLMQPNTNQREARAEACFLSIAAGSELLQLQVLQAQSNRAHSRCRIIDRAETVSQIDISSMIWVQCRTSGRNHFGPPAVLFQMAGGLSFRTSIRKLIGPVLKRSTAWELSPGLWEAPRTKPLLGQLVSWRVVIPHITYIQRCCHSGSSEPAVFMCLSVLPAYVRHQGETCIALGLPRNQ
jgi:hypothetical protein